MPTQSQATVEQRKFYNEQINRRWGQLYELEKDWGEKAMKLLLVVNAGGAIATLSFLGGYDGNINMKIAGLTLSFFLGGVVSMMIVTARSFHHLHRLFNSYRTAVDKFYKDRISWAELDDGDEARAKDPITIYIFAYLAFALFVLGCISGGIGLFS